MSWSSIISWSSKEVTCNECNKEGVIRWKNKDGNVVVRDYIEHEAGCSYAKVKVAKHFKQKKWEKQEKSANELVGASDTVNSGARFKDGDGRRLFEWRVESKQTQNVQYRFYWSIWTELVHKCKPSGEEPLLHLKISNKNFCVINASWFFSESSYERDQLREDSPNASYQELEDAFSQDKSNLFLEVNVDKKKSYLINKNFIENNLGIIFNVKDKNLELIIIPESVFKEIKCTKN